MRFKEMAVSVYDVAEFRYELKYCMIVGKDVWTIKAKQPDGQWKVAGCVEQGEACQDRTCALTMSEGEWPFIGHL
jgi:hypothetical protein